MPVAAAYLFGDGKVHPHTAGGSRWRGWRGPIRVSATYSQAGPQIHYCLHVDARRGSHLGARALRKVTVHQKALRFDSCHALCHGMVPCRALATPVANMRENGCERLPWPRDSFGRHR